jgi:cytochrome b6-f complex iron-sulfur subunit
MVIPKEADMPCKGCSRREFLVGSIKVTAVAGIAAYVLPGCTQAQKPGAPGATTITVDVAQPANAALANVGGAVFVNNPLDADRAIIVFRAATDKVNAFTSRCTHLGGQVQLPVNGVETCILHGSQYSTDGTVILGPATQNLATYTAVVNGTVITITVG